MEHGSESSAKKSRHVFKTDPSRLNRPNDIRDGGPEPSVVLGPLPFTRDAPRLAGEPRNDSIHASAPAWAWEGCEIVPDRSATQGLVFHPRHEDGRRVGIPLDVTNGSPAHSESPEGLMDSEVKSADAGAKGEDSLRFGTYSHTHAPSIPANKSA